MGALEDFRLFKEWNKGDNCVIVSGVKGLTHRSFEGMSTGLVGEVAKVGRWDHFYKHWEVEVGCRPKVKTVRVPGVRGIRKLTEYEVEELEDRERERVEQEKEQEKGEEVL